MKTTYISTLQLSSSSRSQLQSQTALIAKLQIEMSSGRKADVGLDLGAGTGEAVTLRSDFEYLNAIIDTNALTASQLDVTQAALDDVLSNAESMLATLVGVGDTEGSAVTVINEATGSLELLTSRLNTQLNGNYLFAGLNTDVQPIADYTDATSANKTTADTTFFTYFGFTQDDPLTATITEADMTNYLDTVFADMFDDPAWGTNWSTASDQTVTSQISVGETTTTSVSANEDAFRQLAEVYTMLSDLGNANLSDEAYGAIIDKATTLLGSAIDGVTDSMAKMGTAQERVSNASDRLSIQSDLINERINALENVDPEETAVRLTTALTQLETTYSITARIQELSIINYL